MTVTLDTDVLIIGAGMSGVGFAIRLQQDYPDATYEIHEKTDNIGGTWWVNTYPGCGCDVASHFYSYSFELNPDWSQKFALQPEIQRYFVDVAHKYDIPRHVRFQSTVQRAEFDEKSGTWVTTVVDQKTGKVTQRRSRALVAAVGALSIPKGCDIKGAENFQGRMIHSAKWDHSFDWTDKEIVVIGEDDDHDRKLRKRKGCLLTPSRERLQRNSVRASTLLRHKWRLEQRYSSRQSQKDCSIQPAAALAGRAPQPGLRAILQVDYALCAAGNAALSILHLRRHGARFLRLLQCNRTEGP